MIGEVTIAGQRYRVDFSRPRPIAIPLDPHGPQPAFFTERPASARPLRVGDYVGSVSLGGSCNAEEISLVPHCHGTHTEGIGHVSSHPVAVQECIYPGPSLAMLVSLESTPDAQPLLPHTDLAACIDAFWRDGTEAIVIRTLPNQRAKSHTDYAAAPYPVLEAGAIGLLAELPLKHLLILADRHAIAGPAARRRPAGQPPALVGHERRRARSGRWRATQRNGVGVRAE
jgi:hypothetical protein